MLRKTRLSLLFVESDRGSGLRLFSVDGRWIFNGGRLIGGSKLDARERLCDYLRKYYEIIRR